MTKNLDAAAAINNLEAKFMASMSSFEAKMSTSPPATTSMESLAREFAAFKAFMLQEVDLLRTLLLDVTTQLDEVDNTGRKKFLCLHGLKELPDDDDNLRTRIVDVATNNLQLADFTDGDLKSCYRLGKTQKSTKPRPILIRFSSMAVRSQIWKAKKALKGSGITVAEFLTPRRREVFLEARRRFGVSKCWSQDGTIYLKVGEGDNADRVRLDSMQQLDQLRPAKEATPTASLPVPPASKLKKAPITTRPTRAARSAKK